MLITFEGLDGSGKTTQARRLDAALRAAGRATLLVREPGGTALSERIRALLLDGALAIHPFAELLLFSAARHQLVEDTIRPALAAGTVVLCDRFYDSTTAYQGGGRGLADPDWLADFHAHVTGGLVPHRTYYLDVPPAVAAARRAARATGRAADRMESESAVFFERVRAAYCELAAREPARILVLDGTQTPGALHRAILADVEALGGRA